ncbi:MAG: type III-A CRISPR-associated RAMP protein Csm4 [Tissierellia bacterium]|nr:type III-A CRISPR-associated RAMP protein Csm4 [Tissierellia bacterium]
MDYKLFRIQFETGVHIGNGRLTDASNTITADVMFSAMCQEIHRMKGDKGIRQLLDWVNENHLRLSDAFPFDRSDYYLPKPYLTIESTKDSDNKKEYKNLNYIPLLKWKEYLSGSSNPKELKKMQNEISKKGQRTAIGYNPDGEHDIYNTGYQRFQEGAGLYFVLGYSEKSILDSVENLFQSLQYTGIGGKKSAGFGSFSFDTITVPDELQEKIESESEEVYMTLTTSIPDDSELHDAMGTVVGYKLIRRGGYIQSEGVNRQPLRKRDAYLIGAGSVFRSPYVGTVLQVGDHWSHPVYKYAKPIWIGV